MACNSLQWFKWLSGKHKKKQKEKETLTHAGGNHFQWERLQKRHSPSGCANTRVQEEQHRSSSSKEQPQPAQVTAHPMARESSHQHHRDREAELQGQAPGYLKGSGTWGAQKGTWQWHFCWQWVLFVASLLNVTDTWPEKALLAFPIADRNSLERVYR